MRHVFVVCRNITAAKHAFEDSLESFEKLLGEKPLHSYRYLKIDAVDIQMYFVSSESNREIAMGKIIHQVIFHCDEAKVAYENPDLYRELFVRTSRNGFPIEFTLAHLLFVKSE